MKKTLLIFLAGFLLFSCSKPDDTKTTPTTTVNSIITKNWKQYKRYDNNIENTTGDMQYWDIRSDLSVTREYTYTDTTILPDTSYTDTWSLVNNDTELRVLIDRMQPTNGGTDSIHITGYEIYSVLKLTNDTLILEEDLSDETLTWILKLVLIPN
jgi:hypothetical protein